MLYHVSRTPGLKILQPHLSSHGKAYVYTIEDLVTGLLFGAKMDDFDFIIDNAEDGTPRICECYPGALETVYQGRRCSVYEVEEAGFLRGQTSWVPELVCEDEVPVVDETVVGDLYLRLLEEEHGGRLVIWRYESGHRRKIAAHVVDRIFRFGLDLNTLPQTDERFATHYKEIVQALLSVLDGHLLK